MFHVKHCVLQSTVNKIYDRLGYLFRMLLDHMTTRFEDTCGEIRVSVHRTLHMPSRLGKRHHSVILCVDQKNGRFQALNGVFLKMNRHIRVRDTSIDLGSHTSFP